MNIEIIHSGFDGDHLDALADIFVEAFGMKMSAVIEEKEGAKQIFKRAVVFSSAFYAYIDGELVGFAGMQSKPLQFLHFTFSDLRKSLSFLKALTFFIVMSVIDSVRPDELKIQALAVSSSVRGFGIGTRLISASEKFAHENGYRVISLDVVDTNSDAIRLYQRCGFTIKKTSKLGLLTRQAGFTASHYMTKALP